MNVMEEIPGVILWGRYENRTWVIREGFMGHPCGYVLLTPDEEQKYKGRDEWEVDVPMHGGCTYIGDLGIKQGTWVGFDTSHFDDNRFTQNTNYVYEELKGIIDYLIERR